MTADIIAGLVKPLVWDETVNDSFVAETTFGEYVVEEHVGWGMWSPSEPDGCDARSWHSDAAAAQAAAEADYRTKAAEMLDVDKIAALVEAGRLAEQQLIRLGYDGSSSGLTAALAAFQEQKP